MTLRRNFFAVWGFDERGWYEKRPNIVIINPDQMRADSMFHLGNPAAVTPNLDELAKDGVSLRSRLLSESGVHPHGAAFYERLVSPCGRTPHHEPHDA